MTPCIVLISDNLGGKKANISTCWAVYFKYLTPYTGNKHTTYHSYRIHPDNNKNTATSETILSIQRKKLNIRWRNKAYITIAIIDIPNIQIY